MLSIYTLTLSYYAKKLSNTRWLLYYQFVSSFSKIYEYLFPYSAIDLRGATFYGLQLWRRPNSVPLFLTLSLLSASFLRGKMKHFSLKMYQIRHTSFYMTILTGKF